VKKLRPHPSGCPASVEATAGSAEAFGEGGKPEATRGDIFAGSEAEAASV